MTKNAKNLHTPPRQRKGTVRPALRLPPATKPTPQRHLQHHPLDSTTHQRKKTATPPPNIPKGHTVQTRTPNPLPRHMAVFRPLGRLGDKNRLRHNELLEKELPEGRTEPKLPPSQTAFRPRQTNTTKARRRHTADKRKTPTVHSNRPVKTLLQTAQNSVRHRPRRTNHHTRYHPPPRPPSSPRSPLARKKAGAGEKG
nr:hypothetical protein [Candidatus Freyarchaeota archaeon]